MSNNRYPNDLLKPSGIYQNAWKGWFVGIKLTFLPFLIALFADIALAIASHYIRTIGPLYGLKILSSLIILYFLLLAFYRVHAQWRGDESEWKHKLGVYSKRFFPALIAFVTIFLVTTLLMVLGERLMRVLLPYAHLMGEVAAPILISLVGLLAIIWVIICFYWPFYIVRDGESFMAAMRKSIAIAGLTKTLMVYVPAISFVLIFLITNPRFPWMHVVDSIWWVVSVGFIIKWVLGAWVATLTCLMMNQSDLMLERIEAEMEEKRRQKAEKKSKDN